MSNEKFEREFEDFLADEKSRLAELYRKLPQQEPDARLDASVRAMAHRALNPQLVATPQAYARRRSARWLPALGAAAGLVLAAGIAFRLGPSMRSDRSETGAPVSDVITVRTLDLPVPASPPLSPAPPPPPPASASAPTAGGARVSADKAPAAAVTLPAEEKARVAQEAAAPAAPAAAEVGHAAASGESGKIQQSAAGAAAPKAFPEPAQRRSRADEMDAVERKQIMAKGAWQNLHDQDAREAAKSKAATGTNDDGSVLERQALETQALDKQAKPGLQKESAAQAFVPQPAPLSATSPVANAASEPTKPAPPNPISATAAPRPAAPAAALPEGSVAQDRVSAERQEQPQARTTPSPAAAESPRAGSALSGSVEQKKEDRAVPRSSDPNAKLYPEHWLQNVRTMLREHRRDEALRSLAEFRRIYPTYHLPDDLRDLK